MTITHTVEDFKELMVKFNVVPGPGKNMFGVNIIFDLDRPMANLVVGTRLFTGHDASGCVFVNLPIRITKAYDRKIVTSNTAFTVSQRDRDYEFFALGGEPYPLHDDSFFVDSNDLSNLEKLLAGETLRFHENRYTGDTVSDNPDRWT